MSKYKMLKLKTKILLCATVILSLTGSLQAQDAQSLKEDGKGGVVLVPDTYGKSSIGPTLTNNLAPSVKSLCGPVKMAIVIGAAIGVLGALFNMFKAIRAGGGDSGRWRVAFVLLFMSSIMLAPSGFLNMIGMGWLVAKAGPWSCIM